MSTFSWYKNHSWFSYPIKIFRKSFPFLLFFYARSSALQTIDETMPSPIPTEIISDWEAQDGTNYSASIDKIHKKHIIII